MDLDDSFTGNLLQRSKTRKDYLNAKMNETACTVGRKRTALDDCDNLEDSPKRQCLDPSESEEKENEHIANQVEDAFVPFTVSSNVRGLAALRKQYNTDTSKNFNTNSEEDIHDSEVNKQEIHFSSTNNSHPTQRTRLANLAAQINNWEDDLHQRAAQSLNTVSSSLSKKANKSSVCNLSNSNSNSVAFKLFYTNKSPASHNLNVKKNSSLKTSETGFGSKLGYSSMPLVLGNVNKISSSSMPLVLGKVSGSSSKTKVVLSVKASMQENKEKAICLTESLDVPKNDGVKNHNSDGIILEKKETSKKDDGSNFRFEPTKNSEPAALPLAARKAIFEKAATTHNSKSNEPAFQPKLSIAQRTAMFENAAKRNNQVKPQPKLTLPKRFVPSLSVKTSEVNEQGHLEKESSQKDASTSNAQCSSSFEEAAPLEKSVFSSNDNINLTSNPPEQKSVEDIVSSPQNSTSDNVFDVQQQPFVSMNSNSPDKLQGDTSSTQQLFSEDEDTEAQQKSAETASSDLLQEHVEFIAPLKNSVSSGSIDSQQQIDEISAADSQHEATFEEPDRNIMPGLDNHWNKLSSSSSFGNSNSEEEQTGQSEKSSTNAYESEGENADCESNLESEYTAAESLSEYNEGESISGSKTGGSAKDLSFTDLEDEAMEQEVFNPVTFSTEAGLSHFDVETDSVLATDDETSSCNGRNWPAKVNDSMYSTDDISLKSAISETSLCSENASNHKVPHSPTSSCTESIGSNQVEELTEKQEALVRASGSHSPLVHTVSFYRKQRLGSKSSPVVATKRPHSLSEIDNPSQRIQQQIKLLQEEIVRQQAVIEQTSQALNLCHSTAEFSGSSEQIEAERLLLIATQKRLACINEIQCLKSQFLEDECLADGNGTLTITDLKLPLKQEFIASQLKGETSSVHCFLCMIRNGPQVIVSQMVSTSDNITDGELCFSKHIKLQNLPPNFSIVFEVYALKTSKENLSHDKKYHIKREHSKIRLNAKGKKTENKLLLPVISSPGGPNTVRSPSFALIGYTRFTVQNCNKKCFSLDRIPYTSPLEGILKVKLHLHAEHNTSEKGFLTRFEDVGGYGLWNRLWCSLDSHQMSYWKYPDEEEQRKEPLGIIDLRQCVTGQVRPVLRDVCARPNTFLMMTVRPKEKGDRNTLVSESVDTLTTTRHLLSADTKEERIVWCNKLNEALANVRKWDARALRPIEDQKE